MAVIPQPGELFCFSSSTFILEGYLPRLGQNIEGRGMMICYLPWSVTGVHGNPCGPSNAHRWTLACPRQRENLLSQWQLIFNDGAAHYFTLYYVFPSHSPHTCFWEWPPYGGSPVIRFWPLHFLCEIDFSRLQFPHLACGCSDLRYLIVLTEWKRHQVLNLVPGAKEAIKKWYTVRHSAKFWATAPTWWPEHEGDRERKGLSSSETVLLCPQIKNKSGGTAISKEGARLDVDYFVRLHSQHNLCWGPWNPTSQVLKI